MSVSILFFLFCSVCLSQGRTQSKCNCEPVYLTPLIKTGQANAARELSKIEDSELMLGYHSHCGFITVKEEFNSNLFFWFFPHQNVNSVPWVIWLNGGPGVSSLIGLFDLIGPVRIEHGDLAVRDVTWASEYSLLFIDNPVGAGFSFTESDFGYTSNEDQVSEQLYEFLLQFLEMFPKVRGAPLFIAGASYAGKYVPAFAVQIHRNNALPNPIMLKGIMLGNPYIDPPNMMHYSGLMTELGFLEGDQLEKLKVLENTLVILYNDNRMVDVANKFNETIEHIKKATGVNIYNYLHEPSNIKSSLEKFVNNPDIRCAIHAGNSSYDLNNQMVYDKMLADMGNTSLPLIQELLPYYGVLIYSGQLDLILPHSGTMHVIEKMQWPRRSEYMSAQRIPVKDPFDSKVIGYRKEGGNFVNVMIRGCGHNAPKDRPEAVKYIVDDFINKFK